MRAMDGEVDAPVTGLGTTRFVLCRPHGGLNDTLGVIADAWDLADATGRTLVVDGVRSGFATNLSTWFEPLPSDRPGAVWLHPTRPQRRQMERGTCFPEVLAGDVHHRPVDIALHPELSHLEWREPVDRATGMSLRLDLDEAHQLPHDVLVHECFGGGLRSLDALRHLRLTPRAVRRIRVRTAQLRNREYVGLHVRHSDLRSDHRTFLSGMADELAGRTVLVCSDDGAVVRDAPSLLHRSDVVAISTPPVADGQPYQLTHHAGRLRRRQLAEDTLTDLFGLAGACEVRVAEVLNRNNPTTGFGALAQALSSEPDLVATLLRR